MIEVVLRVALLVGLAAVASLAVGRWERRPGDTPAGLRPGVTVITGPDCRLCDPVVRALRRAGAEPWVVDVAELPPGALGASSLPVAVVVDAGGQVVLRRAGRAALDDATALAGVVVAAGQPPR